MWIFLKDAFLSIVQPPAHEGGRNHLLVRARFKGDIERTFPDAIVEETPLRDYRFRATIRRSDVERAIADEVRTLNASNFKGSVDENWRHDVYLKVWRVMEEAQRQRARPGLTPRQGALQHQADTGRQVTRRRQAR